MADVFISHSSIDKELADKVCKTLEDRGLKCWIAPRDIMPGSEWAVAISNAISVVRAMVVIYSKNSAQSTQVPKEIALAEKRGKFILPYKVDDTELEGAFDYYLTGAHWIVANPEKGDYKLEEMYGVIAGILQMPTQNITNNLYIDNVTIHTPVSATKASRTKEKETKPETDKKEKTGGGKAAKEKAAEKTAVTTEEGTSEIKENKKWFWIAGIVIAVLLGLAILLVIMLVKPEETNAEDDWDEYEDEDDRDNEEPYDQNLQNTFDRNFEYYFEEDGIIIYEYTGSDEYVVIPDQVDGVPVTGIDDFAFYQKNVVSVTIPEGVTYIGYSTFLECSQLTEVLLPDSLIVIDEWAFAKTSLGEINIPDGIQKIGRFAFQDSENVVVNLRGEVYLYDDVDKLIFPVEE